VKPLAGDDMQMTAQNASATSKFKFQRWSDDECLNEDTEGLMMNEGIERVGM
jgi:hypothetical protein